MIRIKHVEHVKDHQLKILFSTGETKIVDFENWISKGGFYALPLRDIDYFKKVKLDEFNYSICWPNGADFSPDALYEAGIDVQEQKKKVIQSAVEKSHVRYKNAAYAITKKRSASRTKRHK